MIKLKSDLDVITTIPRLIQKEISKSQKIIGFLYNDPNIDITSPEVEDTLFNKYVFDYDYIDGTTQEEKTMICINVDLPQFTTTTIKNVQISILVVSNKKNIKLERSIFRGVIGNRRDNIACELDNILCKSNDFGIGNLKRESVETVGVGNNSYTAKLLTYSIPTIKVINE